MSLTFKDIYSLIESLPESETITLIGGQALNFWAELYFRDNPEFYSNYGPFTSKDIDFLGGKNEIAECARIWGGSARLPEPFDVSPNSGIVIIPLQSGKNLVIDFLSSVYGLSDMEIRKHRVRILYKKAEFYVIHPLHCLKSRIANIIGLHRNDSDSQKRVKIAVAVVNRRINRLLHEDRKRQALNETESVFHLACDSMLGIPLFVDYGLDIFKAVPEDPRMGEMFIVRRYPQMKQVLDAKRDKKRISTESKGISDE